MYIMNYTSIFSEFGFLAKHPTTQQDSVMEQLLRAREGLQ